MYRLYHSLAILVLFSIIYCDEISSEYIEPSLIFKELIKHDIGTNERDTSDFFQNIILTQIEQNINNELSHLVNPDNILLKKTGETAYIYRFDYDDSLKAMNSEELLDSLESFAYYFWKGEGSADISEKGFKNYIYPSFYDEFITKYKNLFEKFQSTHVDLDENTAYNNFINNLELFNNEKENLLQNVKYFLSWSTRYYYTIYVDKTISTSIFSPLKNIIYDLYPHTKDCIECIGIISTNLDSMLLADGIKQKTVLLNREDIYDDSWAVIIGIDKYENLSNLDYAVADAEAVQDMLVSKFDYKEENIKLLLNEEANKTNIVNVISDVSLNAGKNDRILIFYSGHGETMHLPDGGEMGYLLPIDGSQDNLFASAIPMDDLTDFSNMSKAKHMLFLVDACYGGLAAVGTKSLDAKKTPNYIEKITNRKSRQIITAGGKTEKVIEKSEWGHSAFTKNLLSALGERYADSNSDSYITADELGDYLSEKVTIDSENQQTPQSRRLTSHEGEFVFVYSENPAIIQDESADAKLDLEPSDKKELKSKESSDDGSVLERARFSNWRTKYAKDMKSPEIFGISIAFCEQNNKLSTHMGIIASLNKKWITSFVYGFGKKDLLNENITPTESLPVSYYEISIGLHKNSFYVADNLWLEFGGLMAYSTFSWQNVENNTSDKMSKITPKLMSVIRFRPLPSVLPFLISSMELVGEFSPHLYNETDGEIKLDDWQIQFIPGMSISLVIPKFIFFPE